MLQKIILCNSLIFHALFKKQKYFCHFKFYKGLYTNILMHTNVQKNAVSDCYNNSNDNNSNEVITA